MKVIVAGGRKFNDETLMLQTLNRLLESGFISKDVELVCGMAEGADLMAKAIFEDAGLVVHTRPADWNNMSKPCVIRNNTHGQYNALAGHKRNRAMGNEADKLIAFWDEKSAGTKDMIKYMAKLGKPLVTVNY